MYRGKQGALCGLKSPVEVNLRFRHPVTLWVVGSFSVRFCDLPSVHDIFALLFMISAC